MRTRTLAPVMPVAAALLLALPVVAGAEGAPPASYGPDGRALVIGTSFTKGYDGWTTNTPTQVTWQRKGGEAGGYVKFSDQASDSTQVSAPKAYLRVFRNLSPKAEIVYYHRIINETGIASIGPYTVYLTGPKGAATWTGSTPSGVGPWVKVVVPMRQADWTVTSGTWKGLLSNVTAFTIQVEQVSNDEIPGDKDIEGVDEVQIRDVSH